MSVFDQMISSLGLEPHPEEGGFYRETYRSAVRHGDSHDLCTAIYYLLTPETMSEMHRLPSDEIFHFYMGHAVEMLQLMPDGSGRVVRIGTDLAAGERPQVVVPAGTWFGSRLVAGGEFALLGCTVAPGFEFADYESGERAGLVQAYPEHAELISALTHAPA